MSGKATHPLPDFDDLLSLAQQSPDEFEDKRKKVIEEAIARAPEARQERLRALQWRIEQVRERSANPLAACISLSNMMWDAFSGSHGLVETLNKGTRLELAEDRPRADVVPLRPRKMH